MKQSRRKTIKQLALAGVAPLVAPDLGFANSLPKTKSSRKKSLPTSSQYSQSFGAKLEYNTKEAHEELEKFVETGQAGIGISIEVIRRIVEQQITRTNTYYSRIPFNQKYESSSNEKFSIYFECLFDTSKGGVAFYSAADTDPTRLNIQNLGLSIDVWLESPKHASSQQLRIAKMKIDYQLIQAILNLNQDSLVVEYEDALYQAKKLEKLWETNNQLVDYYRSEHKFTDDDWRDIEVRLRAISMVQNTAIAQQIIESVKLPNVFDIFKGVKFNKQGASFKLGVDTEGNMLMFASDAELVFSNCSTYGLEPVDMNLETIIDDPNRPGQRINIDQLEPTERSNERVLESMSIEGSANVNSEEDGIPDIPKIAHSDVFLHAHVELLQVNFDSVKPSIHESDRGSFGPIFWDFRASALVKKLRLELRRLWPLDFKMNLEPITAHGFAGAGIKIGCITYRALNAAFEGEIDRFQIGIYINPDWVNRQIVLVSKIEAASLKEFNFYSGLKFPLNKIAELLLERAARKMVNGLTGQILNVTRIPIGDLRDIHDVAPLLNVMSGHGNKTKNNLTIGVAFAT
ncbi:MAG: hypothetical protein ABJF04_25765 [Reichenbachiella sp.]|uniref:hypothetical protein n=1 Tax=Reichenbachiella sp. TaxID=2184521 RepID=UPI0032669A1D